MDALSRILSTVRLQSSILSVAELSAPFGVATTGVSGAAVFHAVVRGRAVLSSRAHTLELGAGDVALLAHGQEHELASEVGRHAVPIRALPHLPGPVPVVRNRAAGTADTRIVCGVFRLDHAASESLLSLLPPLLHHRQGSSNEDTHEWVSSTVRMLDRELSRAHEGSAAIAARLCDVLFVQLLRSLPLTERGWLGALRDPQIGRALALIHEDPGTRWDAAVLAERVGMSRSRFFARFSELVGEPPAQYLSRWRMNVAADTLLRADVSVPQLAEQSGYASEDAFARVFKRHFGRTPAAFRRDRGTPRQGSAN